MDNYYTYYQICLRPIKNMSNEHNKYHIRKCTISKNTDIIVNIENYIFGETKLNRLLSIVRENSYCFVNSSKFSNYKFPHTYKDIIKLQFREVPKPKNTGNFNIYITHVPSIESFKIENNHLFLEKYEMLSSSI